jgi:hypothetical protein
MSNAECGMVVFYRFYGMMMECGKSNAECLGMTIDECGMRNA